MTVQIIPCLEDNYAFLLSSDEVVVIDPAESDPVLEALDGKNLNYVLCTHHHTDHTSGIQGLKKEKSCKVFGPDRRIASIDELVKEGDLLPLGIEVIFTPGHTSSSVCYHWKGQKKLFSGDTLFGGGCGRLFEGTAEEMFSSLKKITNLSDDTEIYCGHEYTLKNLEFALTIEPDNRDLQKRIAETEKLREMEKPTLPFTLGLEKKTNPFLRTHQLKDQFQLSEVETFAKIRTLRNSF